MDLRLNEVAKYVIGDSMCDVGCDHGQLCAKVLTDGKVKKAYGIDISKASLSKSEDVKKRLGLDNLELLAGDGFTPVKDRDVDCGVVCGIGSRETIDIIKREQEFAKRLKKLILCPQKNTFTVREFLLANSFVIDDEDLVFEKGRYYNIFVCSAGKPQKYSDVDIYVGRRLIEKNHPLLKVWLEKRIRDMENNINRYDDNVKEERKDKRDNMVRMMTAYTEGRKLCK